LREIETVADRLQQEMTDIAYGLRPHQLDNIGLSKTIESMIRRVERATNVTFTTEIPIIDNLIPHDAHIHVFRIVQEGVSNVIAHAQASAARVTVGRDGSHVRIEIEDNGKGFSSERHVAGATSGFGLMGIRERARLLGGDMDVQSGDGGTLLTITLPAGRTGHE
jgi:signal transduction histidine kinase